MTWAGTLDLDYTHRSGRTVVLDRHDGPLRVLRSLYPEGDGICHQVLVHPPGGIVGGDTLQVTLRVDTGSHALITTPGATRFYRSAGSEAAQHVSARVEAGGRLEWLPQETLVYDGARAVNRMRFDLEPGAEMIGLDLLALGQPASGQPFTHGSFDQCIELPGQWIERSRLDLDGGAEQALTERLLVSPLGWAGCTVLGTLWWARGPSPLRRDPQHPVEPPAPVGTADAASLVEAARELIDAAPAHRSGATALSDDLVVVRILGERTEAPARLLRSIRLAWRAARWQLSSCEPRVWST